MKSKQRLSDLKVMTDDQLTDELLKLKKEQFNLRFQRATGQLENTSRVRVVRREIARTKTIAAHLLSGTAIDSLGGVSSWPLGGKISTHGNGIGAFAGYNSQWDDVVLGVELSYMHGNFGGSQTDSMTRFFNAGGGYTDTVTYDATGKMAISDMGTFRARAGYAVSSFLPYMFGGVALGQANIIRTAHVYGSQINPNVAPPFNNVPFDLSATDAQNSHLIYGYSGGLGVDVMLCAGLFLRAEWEYVRFTSSIDTSINTVRAGLGYKF